MLIRVNSSLSGSCLMLGVNKICSDLILFEAEMEAERNNLLHDIKVKFNMENFKRGNPDDLQNGMITSGESNLFERLMTNCIVAEKILSFLSFQDVKSLCEVSTKLLASVRSTAEYSNRAVLVVGNNLDELSTICTLTEMRYSWKHLDIDVSTVPTHALDLLKYLMEHAESIYLKYFDKLVVSEKVEPWLQAILKNCNNLKMLGIEVEILTSEFPTLLTSIREKWSLESLQIEHWIKSPLIGNEENLKSIKFKPGRRTKSYRSGSYHSSMMLEVNILGLFSKELKLKRLQLGEVSSPLRHLNMPSIVQANKDYLEEIELPQGILEFDEMKDVVCGRLKRFALSKSRHEPDPVVLESFIKNHQNLEELSLSIKRLPKSVLEIIGEMRNLKRLHIKTKYFIGDQGRPEQIDWDFLEGMEKLKEFYLRRLHTCNYERQVLLGSAENILKCIPASVERIRLEGLEINWGGGRRIENIPGVNLQRLLIPFESLKELNLHRSGIAITDEDLQFIIAKCKGLQSLAFSLGRVTGYGISGVLLDIEDAGRRGFGLNELMKLEFLSIRQCPLLDENELVEVLTFQELKYFICDIALKDPKLFVTKLIKRNPRLEAIALNFGDLNRQEIELIGVEVKILSTGRIHTLIQLEEVEFPNAFQGRPASDGSSDEDESSDTE